MTESAIKANQREAARLFERGSAAARSGQRRVAAGLLARAVQLNPRHELAWLWLSGVLENPDEIAFCLRSVLSVNPHNERARQGLAWLEQRALIAPQPIPSAPAEVESDAEEQPDERHLRHEGESWWVNWRRSRRDMDRARLVFWSVPILLLLLTLSLNQMLRGAVVRNTVLAAAPPAAVAPTPAPLQVAIVQAELAPMRNARTLAYLSAIDELRARLREAVQVYREATSRPGGSSGIHAGAARQLREQIDAAYRSLERLTPPPALAEAHAAYLAGLALERSALDDMLEFYGSFSISLANRATLRMEDASRHFEQAHVAFEERRAWINTSTAQAHTAR